MAGAALAGTSCARRRPILAKLMEPTIVMPSILTSSMAWRPRRAATNPCGNYREKANNDQAERDRRGTFCEEVGGGGHWARALEFQPTGGELRGHADSNAKEGGPDEAEASVASEHVFRDVDIASEGIAVGDAEEYVCEHEQENRWWRAKMIWCASV